jgi:16S rRNA (uracil1498-N3)-methyltransferase
LLSALGEQPKEVLALVGPEGGFAPEEVDTAVAAGGMHVTLGRRRLRAETAGIAAVNAVMLHAQRGG